MCLVNIKPSAELGLILREQKLYFKNTFIKHRLNILSLRKKEVIQAHIPIGLPCYDFRSITNSTVVAPIPYGFG